MGWAARLNQNAVLRKVFPRYTDKVPTPGQAHDLKIDRVSIGKLMFGVLAIDTVIREKGMK